MDRYKVEKLVFRVFLKHIKEHNLYVAFRWSVNCLNKNKDIFHTLGISLCPREYKRNQDIRSQMGSGLTSSCRSTKDIIMWLHKNKRVDKLKNTVEFQLSIMNMVNALLHDCVEHKMSRNIREIEKIGSEIFEEVGKTLFGSSFEDITEQGIEPKQKEFIEKIKEGISEFNLKMGDLKKLQANFINDYRIPDSSNDYITYNDYRIPDSSNYYITFNDIL